MDSPPPYFSSPPDVWIPIPNTPYRLPLTWEHTRAIQVLSRFFARLFLRVQELEDTSGLEKYRSWMITLFQMTASIHEGNPRAHPSWGFFGTGLMVELVCRNDAEEICRYLTYDDLGAESLEALEEANDLITPIMNYIRDCKGLAILPLSSLSWSVRAHRADCCWARRWAGGGAAAAIVTSCGKAVFLTWRSYKRIRVCWTFVRS